MQYIPFLRGLPEQKERAGKWYLYLLFTGICLLCYLPYYLMYYPGWLSNDVVWQICSAQIVHDTQGLRLFQLPQHRGDGIKHGERQKEHYREMALKRAGDYTAESYIEKIRGWA